MADLLDALAGQVQMLASELDLEAQVVIDRGITRRFLESEGEVRDGQIGISRKLLQAHIALQMLCHEAQRLVQIVLVRRLKAMLGLKPGKPDDSRQVARQLRDMDNMVQRISLLQQIITLLEQLHHSPRLIDRNDRRFRGVAEAFVIIARRLPFHMPPVNTPGLLLRRSIRMRSTRRNDNHLALEKPERFMAVHPAPAFSIHAIHNDVSRAAFRTLPIVMKRTREISNVRHMQRLNKRMPGSFLHNMIRQDDNFLGLKSV